MCMLCIDTRRKKRQVNRPANTYELETEETSVTIGNLDPETQYTVAVVAETSAGRGNTMATVTIATGKIFLKRE